MHLFPLCLQPNLGHIQRARDDRCSGAATGTSYAGQQGRWEPMKQMAVCTRLAGTHCRGESG